MNSFSKLASESYDPIEIVFYRCILALALLCAWLVATGRYDLLKTDRPMAHIGRSVVGNISVSLVFWAYSLMPMAHVTTILLTSGIVVTILSSFILHEKITPMRWAAVSCGLLGSLIASNPAGPGFNLVGTGVAFLAMMVTSIVPVLLRSMGKTENAFTTVFYFFLAGTCAGGLYVLYKGHMPRLEDMGMLGGTAIAAVGVQIARTNAFKLVEASVLSPLNYTALIWAILLGWLIWDDAPDLAVMIGASLVIASNLGIIWWESKKVPAQVSDAAP